MKFCSLAASIVFGLLLAHSVQCQTPAETPKRHGFASTTTFHYNGHTYTYDLGTIDLSEAPSWNPATDEPLLSMRKAVEIGQTAIRRFVKPGDDWQIHNIAANEMESDKWIYYLVFSCWSRKCFDENSSSFTVLVKMDGLVVEPKIKPDEKSQ